MVAEMPRYADQEERSRSEYPFWIKRFPGQELASKLRDQKPDVRGLVNDFRDYGAYHNGLPTDLESLEEIAMSRFWSRYKFRRLWQKFCAKFFTEYAGKLWYEPDYEQIIRVHDISKKRSNSGRLGAERKHGQGAEQPAAEPVYAAAEPFSGPENSGNCQEGEQAFATVRASNSNSFSSSLSTYIEESTEEEGSVRGETPEVCGEIFSPNTIQQVEGLRQLWEAGGQPWTEGPKSKDESCVREFLSKPPEVQQNICEYAAWAFSSGRWREPAFTPKFWRYIASGDGEKGMPRRTLPPPKPPKSAREINHEIAGRQFLAEQAAKRKAAGE